MKLHILGRRLLNSILPVLLAFIVGGIVIVAIGENPFETYAILLEKSLFTSRGFFTTLHYASPLILTGLAIAVTFKANIYNMGVEGSMLLGALKNATIDKRADLTDEESDVVIRKEIKQTMETLETTPADRAAVIEQCKLRISVYETFVPKMMTVDEIKNEMLSSGELTSIRTGQSQTTENQQGVMK